MEAKEVNEKLKESCIEAVAAIDKLKSDDFDKTRSKIEWCVGSYDNDQNPVGLHESCTEVLALFLEFKKSNPRKIAKKVIDNIEKSIKEYEALNA